MTSRLGKVWAVVIAGLLWSPLVQAQEDSLPQPPLASVEENGGARLVPPAESVEAQRDPILVGAVQMVAAAAAGIVLTPVAWGGPYVVEQVFVSRSDLQTRALVLLSVSLVSGAIFAGVVAATASVVGAFYARRAAPDFRMALSAGAGILTAALCSGTVVGIILASSTLAAAAVGFWLVGLPMTAIVAGAAATVVALYLENRHPDAKRSVSLPKSETARAMRY